MKILIISGSGVIGSYLIKSCKNEGYDTEFTFYKNKPRNGQGHFLDITKHKDTIELKDKSKELLVIAVALVNKEREIPDYIQMDGKNKIAKLIRVPKFSEVPYPTIMEPNLVVEYYSR